MRYRKNKISVDHTHMSLHPKYEVVAQEFRNWLLTAKKKNLKCER
jgi:hypothetical protein